MITQQQASEFAKQWIEAWNSHDLDRIMMHYAENIEFYSPFIVSLGANNEGRIQGQSLLRQYFEKGLTAYHNLNFKLHHVLCGVNSLVISYESVNGKLASEVMQLDITLRATHVLCHYYIHNFDHSYRRY